MIEQQNSKRQASIFQLKRFERISNSNEGVFFSLASRKDIECSKCIITYDSTYVNSNDGSRAIDPETGIFEAPFTGNYFFQFHALVAQNKQARVQVLKLDFYENLAKFNFI